MSSSSNEAVARSRLLWVDRLKACAIVLVVIGHSAPLAHRFPALIEMIFVFHVPLFFVITGMTLGISMNGYQVLARSVSLLWIFFAVASIFVFRDFLQPPKPMPSVLAGLAYGSGLTIRAVPLWFLPCLALAVPMAWMTLKTVSQANGAFHPALGFAATLAWLLLGATVLEMIDTTPVHALGWGSLSSSGAFWNADIALMGAGYVILGASLITIANGLRPRQALLTACSGALVFAMICMSAIPAVDLNIRSFHPTGSALVGSLAGVVAAVFLLRALGNAPEPGAMTAVGRATLPILAFHNPIQSAINASFGAPSPTLVALVAAAIAIVLPTLLDRWALSSTPLGQILFYPRSFAAHLRRAVKMRVSS